MELPARSLARTGAPAGPVDGCPGSRATKRRPGDDEAPTPTPSTRPRTGKYLGDTMGNDGGGAILQIISPSARTGFGVPSTGGGGTSTALTVASGADSITVTSPISIPFTSATGSPLRRR